MGGFAWVTLATNDSYSLGALVLAHSLKAVGTAHQLAVLVTPGVTNAMREKLSAVFNLVEEVNILDSRDEANLRLLKRPELGITFTKLHCWRLTQFEKCVFLDADTLVLQHCDELFDREELSAAPDVGWPDCFNSGVFVYRPSLETYDKLIQFALEKGSFDGGDQGLLNLYFSDWAHKDISRHLPFIYNMCSTACYSYLPAFKQFGANAKIIHFIGAQKPWLQYFNTETRKVQPSGDSSHLQEVLQKWWDIFCSLIHPQLSPAMAGLAGAFAQLTLGVPRTPEQDAFENVLRKQAWEVGNIDYLGRDSFDNIWSKISATLSGLSAPESAEPAVEPEPTAPAQSQSESAPTQAEVEPPLDTTTSAPTIEASIDQQQSPLADTSTLQEVVEPKKSEPSVAESPKASEVVKEEESSQPQPLPEIPDSPKEPSELPIAETKPAEIQAEVAATDANVQELKTDISDTKTATLSEPQEAVTEKSEISSEVEACPLPQKKEVEKAAEPEVAKETEAVVESVCSLPAKKEGPKETETQVVVAPKPEQKQPEALPLQTETKETIPAQKVALPSQESPKETPQVQELPAQPSPVATKEPETASKPQPTVPQLPEVSPQPTAPQLPEVPPQPEVVQEPAALPKKSEASAPSATIPKKVVKPMPKETPVASEATAAPASSKETTKAASSKDSPKTKVTAATPPVTPGSPLVEKTKEALAAEASIPDTPPPTEEGSTPTPPPRKTDKPKKVAAKPKK